MFGEASYNLTVTVEVRSGDPLLASPTHNRTLWTINIYPNNKNEEALVLFYLDSFTFSNLRHCLSGINPHTTLTQNHNLKITSVQITNKDISLSLMWLEG